MNSETRSRMSSFSASSVVRAGDVDANRARWIVDARSDTSERPIRSTSSVRPGRDGTTRTPAAPTANEAFRGATSKRPSLTRRDAPRPFGSSDTARPPSSGSVRTSDRSRCRVSVASASRNRTRRGPSRSRSTRLAAAVASADDTTGRTVTIRSWTLVGRVRNDRRSAFRSTPVPGRASTTRIDSVRDIDPGVAPRLAEPVVEPVGELRRGDRPEAIGELHVPAVPEPHAGEHPGERSPVVRLGDGVRDERSGAKLAAARRGESAARPDEADGEIQARGGRPGHGDPRLALRQPAHVHARDRRSARQRVALEKRDRPERGREHGHEARRRARGRPAPSARGGGAAGR